MPTRHCVVDPEPLLRPTPVELAIAPALGVLAALDATLVAAAYQLHAEHPAPTLEALARGDLAGTEARTAGALIFRCADLRAALREYRAVVVAPSLADDQLHLPF